MTCSDAQRVVGRVGVVCDPERGTQLGLALGHARAHVLDETAHRPRGRRAMLSGCSDSAAAVSRRTTSTPTVAPSAM